MGKAYSQDISSTRKIIFYIELEFGENVAG